MTDAIVSVRMPLSLVDELKLLAEKNHFLDVSEEIRSLLRDEWQKSSDPYSIRLMAISETAKKAVLPDKIDVLKKDLKKLLEEINELS